jgi:hypothetical protein
MNDSKELTIHSNIRATTHSDRMAFSRPQSVTSAAQQFAFAILAQKPFRDFIGGLCFVAMALTFVVWGAARMDIGAHEARAAMAAREPIGPVGQSFGGLDPAIYPGSLVLPKLWAQFEDNGPGIESIRWPAAIVALLIAAVLALRTEYLSGKSAALWVSLGWLSSLAVIHRSGEAGIDIIGGFGLVLALDHCAARRGRADWVCGLLASIAFLCSGLPPLILISAASIVISRSSAGLSLSYLAIVLTTIAGWSAWALSEISAEAWAAAIALPVSFRNGANFPVTTAILSLPAILFLPTLLGRRTREGWDARRTDYVNSWWTVAAMCLFAGTILPQFASAALLPIVAGSAVASGHAWSAVLARRNEREAGFERLWVKIASVLIVSLSVLSIPALVYISLTIPYYRTASLFAIFIASLAAISCVSGMYSRDIRRFAAGFVLACVTVKIAHASIYVPEWNYRRGQGPWGRAVGQWVPEGWPIYALNGWSADFAFATGHNFRQITHPRFLPDPANTPDGRPSFILLHPADFEHWPKTAPPLIKIFEFHDHSGPRVSKVLARTGPEKPAWQKLIYGNTVVR